jgi:uncharacterized protein
MNRPPIKKTNIKQPGKKKIKRATAWQIGVAAVIVLSFLLFLVIPNISSNDKRGEDYMFKKDGELIFLDSLDNVKAKIEVEIADTEYRRQLGLMVRTEMETNQGMLFIFPDEIFRSFWMRNTHLSLDMIFVNSQKQIVTIHKNTTPLAETSYPSTAPAQFVVEVLAGFTDTHGIQEGDKIHWMEMRKD